MADETLAQRVRAKFPGAYDDLTDQQLEAAVKSKFPGVYDDIPTTPAETQPSGSDRMGPGPRGQHPHAVIGDVVIGAGKGLANTLVGAGEMAYKYLPGVARVSDAVNSAIFPNQPTNASAFAKMRPTPTNAAQQVGFTGEQIGEFFTPIPGGKTRLAKTALEAAKAGVLSLAQSGSPTAAGVSAGVTAALPGTVRAVGKMAGKLQQSAEKSVVQALGATKESAKATAARLAPEMLRRGVKGTREAMLDRAKQASDAVGQRLGALYRAAGERGETISGLAIRGELQLAKDALMVPGRTGAPVAVPGTERVLTSLDKLEAGLEKMGDDIPVHHAAAIKTAWDRIVAKAGLYGPKAAASATDSAEAWAVREGASALRTALQSANPDIALLSKEYAFWKGLKDVLKATELRTQAQSGGLQAALGATTGGVSGFASGGDITDSLTKAFVGAAAGRQFVRLVQSPWWRTSVSGPLKAEMAKALGSGNARHATNVMGQIMAALPAQARTVLAN